MSSICIGSLVYNTQHGINEVYFPLEGAIAQLGERYNGIVEVGGSIPPSSTKIQLKEGLVPFV